MFFGLTRQVVLITLLPFLPASIYFFYKRRYYFLNYFKFNFKAILLCCFVISVYFVALNPAILGRHDNYFVMSGVNWQDTALHLSITQGLTQGNFPPQAPYFSGVPLSYYYFTDLHSAIIDIVYGKFFPRVFVYDNTLLAGVLTLTIYSLAFELSKNRKLACMSAFMGSFYGSFIFVKFFKEIFAEGKLREILVNNTYSMEYQKLFGMANMADYYLQNRSMMVGLPVVIIVIILAIYAFKKEKLNIVLLAGLLTATLVKFQFFCVLAAGVSFLIISTPFLKKAKFKFITKLKFITKFKFILRSYLLFTIPILIFYLIFGTRSVNGTSFFNLVKDTFHFGPWDSTKPLMWHIEFILLNLGLPFLITLVALVKAPKQIDKVLSLLALVFVVIPYLVTFTIAEGDMLKFFYFAAVPFSVITPIILDNMIKNKIIFNMVMVMVIFTSTFASVLTLGNSYLNKNFGYSLADYNVGVWIRNNTPQKSVFVTMPTIHSAPSDFGGRLRVISYTNWPYSHGYNIGDDDVFSRVSDVEAVYKTGEIANIKLKYNAQYIYYGEDESGQFPEAWELFDFNANLRLVYDQEGIKIYQII